MQAEQGCLAVTLTRHPCLFNLGAGGFHMGHLTVRIAKDLTISRWINAAFGTAGLSMLVGGEWLAQQFDGSPYLFWAVGTAVFLTALLFLSFLYPPPVTDHLSRAIGRSPTSKPLPCDPGRCWNMALRFGWCAGLGTTLLGDIGSRRVFDASRSHCRSQRGHTADQGCAVLPRGREHRH